MRRTKGKWVASYRDTWSVDMTLSPIIHAALVRFRSLSDRDLFGVPCVISDDFGLSRDENGGLEDIELGLVYWEYVIDCMIYAFDQDVEPKISDYNFHMKMEKVGEKDPVTKTQPIRIITTNKKEKEKYELAHKEWEERCKLGREYFAKYYTNLWW